MNANKVNLFLHYHYPGKIIIPRFCLCLLLIKLMTLIFLSIINQVFCDSAKLGCNQTLNSQKAEYIFRLYSNNDSNNNNVRECSNLAQKE